MREQLCKARIDRVLKKEEGYTFGELLTQIRKAHRLSRDDVSSDLRIAPLHLFYLEHDRSKKPVPVEELKLLAEYYGVDFDMLKAKMISQHYEVECPKPTKIVQMKNPANSCGRTIEGKPTFNWK